MLKSSGVKIVATLGPSVNNEEKIEELIKAGASMFRVNSSHSTPEAHKETIDMVRKVAAKLGTNTAILLDLQGPKIRVAKLEAPIKLVEGENVKLRHETEYKDNIIPVDYEGIARDVKSGDTIYLDDGKLELRVDVKHNPCLEVGLIKVDFLHEADNDAGALYRGARLQTADVVKIGVELVGLRIEAEIAEIGRLQRHEQQSHKAQQHEKPNTKFQCLAFHSFHQNPRQNRISIKRT